MHVRRGLIVDGVQSFAGALALVIRGRAHELVLPLDSLHAVVAGFSDDAGNFSRPRRCRIERLVEQAGETLQSMARNRRYARPWSRQASRCARLGRNQLVGALIALFQKIHRVGERASVHAELRCKFAEFTQSVGGHGVERADMLFHDGGAAVAFGRDVVHGGDERGHARHHRALEGAHVLVGAAEHLLQQNVGLAQTLKQCRWCPTAACRVSPACRRWSPKRSASIPRSRRGSPCAGPPAFA